MYGRNRKAGTGSVRREYGLWAAYAPRQRGEKAARCIARGLSFERQAETALTEWIAKNAQPEAVGGNDGT